jgi:hypothetical protein
MPISARSAYSAYSIQVHAVVREVLHVIGEIDYQHEADVNRADETSSDEQVKNFIMQKIRAAHQRRRQPYIDLLNNLRSL